MTTPPTTLPTDPEKKRLDRLALVVSVISLLVSGLTSWDAHKSGKRDDERARPQFLVLRPTATLAPNIVPAGSLLVGLQNTGDLQGWLTQVTVRPLTGEVLENGPDHKCYEDIGNARAIPSQVSKMDTALPKRSTPFVAIFNFPESCSLKRKSVAAGGPPLGLLTPPD